MCFCSDRPADSAKSAKPRFCCPQKLEAVRSPLKISPSALTRLSRCVAGVACSFPVLFGPEQPLLSLPRFGVCHRLGLRLPLGLLGGLGGGGRLPSLFTLRFRGLFFRANGGGSLLCLCFLARGAAGSPFGYYGVVDWRTGLVFRESGASSTGGCLLTLLKARVLECRHAYKISSDTVGVLSDGSTRRL